MPLNPVKAKVDAFHLERALVNVLCNAMEASETGQDMNILLYHGQDCLAIRIQDHGTATDRETVGNMFTKTTQQIKGIIVSESGFKAPPWGRGSLSAYAEDHGLCPWSFHLNRYDLK